MQKLRAEKQSLQIQSLLIPKITCYLLQKALDTDFKNYPLFVSKLTCCFLPKLLLLTLSRRRPIPYRNLSTDLQSKSIDWFLHDIVLPRERVKYCCRSMQKSLITCNIWNLFYCSILSRGFGPYKMKRMQSCSFLKNYVTACLSLVSKP